MARLPNFTRGTRGKDESRSSVKEVLTSKPRAVINPNFSFGHFDVARAGSNYNVVAPSKRGWTPAQYSLRAAGTILTRHHLAQLAVADPRGSTTCVFEFDQSSTDATGRKNGSNSNRITVGLQGLSTKAHIVGQFIIVFRAALGFDYLYDLDALLQEEGGETYLIIKTTGIYTGSPVIYPYTNYGDLSVVYSGNVGFDAAVKTDGTSSDEPIQPPFSVASRILRGS